MSESYEQPGRWSGTEGRHRQAFHVPIEYRRYGRSCECVSLKCNGAMVERPDGKMECEKCGLVIRREGL
jgi:hypothetical protein